LPQLQAAAQLVKTAFAPCRTGAVSSRSNADSVGSSGRPATPAQRVPGLPATAAIPRLALGSHSSTDLPAGGGRPPSSRLASGRAGSSRLGGGGGGSARGADGGGGGGGGASGPGTPLASPPQGVTELGAAVTASSPTRAGTRLRQGSSPSRRKSSDVPRPAPHIGSPSCSLSGGLSLALRPSPNPQKAAAPASGSPDTAASLPSPPAGGAAGRPATGGGAQAASDPAAVATPTGADVADATRGAALSQAGSVATGSAAGSAAGSAGGSARGGRGPGSVVSPGGSSVRSGGNSGSESESDDDEGSSNGEGEGDEAPSGIAAAAAVPAAASRQLPEGFQFTGDLDDDVERLEALDLDGVRPFSLRPFLSFYDGLPCLLNWRAHSCPELHMYSFTCKVLSHPAS